MKQLYRVALVLFTVLAVLGTTASLLSVFYIDRTMMWPAPTSGPRVGTHLGPISGGVAIYLQCLFSFWGGSMTALWAFDPEWIQEPEMLALACGALSASMLGILTIVYLIRVFRNDSLTPKQRWVWSFSIFISNFLLIPYAMPLYLWKEWRNT